MRLALLCWLSLCSICLAAPPLITAIRVEGHTRTQPETILREVLVGVGQPVDSTLVAESGRNLRRLAFLGQVRFHTRPSPGGVELVVEVEDLHARVLSPLLAGHPDELSYGLVALDYNLGGRGHLAQLSLHHRPIEGDEISLYFENPRLGSSSRALGAEARWSAEGHDLAASFSQPFRALGQPWSYGASAFDTEQVHRLYQASAVQGRYRELAQGGALWLTRSLGRATKLRPGFRLSFSDRRYTASPGYDYAPADQRRVLPSLSLTLWRPRYAQDHFLRQLGRTEDLQVGSWLTLRAGLSRRGLGNDRNFTSLSLQLSPRTALGRGTYLFATLWGGVQLHGGQYRELSLLAEFLGYRRLGASHSLALRLQAETLSRPEVQRQFLLGADNGLRGVLPRLYGGQRRLLGNIEFRPTFCRRPWWVLAGAFFADAGMAWNGPLPRPKAAAGVGLRLGLPRLYNSPVLRTDLARGFGGSWLLSLGLGQYF
ncbi:MAG: BamA/TamA family outer membrane protein [Candidatus Handelsmanbacteria bacterium]|nr:BamA/TamA family outer membrane protein [Candidatus Handelsmanbacteria bacterium]